MAEKVLFNIAGGILGSLAGPPVAEEMRLLLGAEGELEKLTGTISTIKAVLLDAEERQSKSHAVRLWLERLSDVLYEADDLIDVVSTEVQRREIMTQDKMAKKVRIFFSKSNQLTFRHKVGHKIKAIRERLNAIKADGDFHLNERLEETPVKVRGRADTYSFVLEQHVIGRENDTKAIIRSLLDTNMEGSLSILPIVGIGGLGKTTVAQLVFNDEMMQNFDLKLWVCVSHNFNEKIIVEKILESADVNPEGDQMEKLVNCLRKKILTKKFFLVLDDVWNEDCEQWFELKKLLLNGVVGSKILVTTRSNEVARITHTIKPYILKGLGEEESWDLFKKMAFNGKEVENLSIIEIGKEIVRKCGGVPLALGVIGRMLFGKDLIDEWLAFRDNQPLRISETTILSTLKLSYDILPFHLKHCFVYCSLFPKDHEFNKSMLIKLWIAQGFVKSQQNRCLEDIGDDYFMKLVSRLFFHKEVVSSCFLQEDRNVFKMHDLMHDVATSMAGSSIITNFNSIGEDAIQKAHHISFHDPNNISSLYKVSRTWTLIMDRIIHWGIYEGLDLEKVISSLKLLRVLVWRNICFGLDNIGKLEHLRYLDLSGLQISKLPNFITRLINLETLILSGCKDLKKFPKGILELVNLRHIDNSHCNKCRLPRGIDRLTNLQTLLTFVVTQDSSAKHDARFEEIIGLKNLKGKLQLFDWKNGITGMACESKTNVDPEVKSIFNILKLKGLKFPNFPEPMTCHFHTYIKEHVSPRQLSSRPLSFLSTLTTLVSLTVSGIPRCKHLPPLCQLPSLEEVHFCHMPDLEYILGCCDKNQLSSLMMSKKLFPSLKFLKINNCDNLKGWLWRNSLVKTKANNSGDNSVVEHCSPPMFSCLSKLSITSSFALTSMPLVSDTLEDLSLESINWKLNLRPMLGSSIVSKLKKLELTEVRDIETLPTEGLQYLTSLENLKIDSLHNLKSIDLGLLHLTSLKSLILCNCSKLESANDENGVPLQGLGNLFIVQFERLPKLVSLPWCLQSATTLASFIIKDCENLTIIPEWICNYKSLIELKIVNCSCLTYVPEEVERLPSLELSWDTGYC